MTEGNEDLRRGSSLEGINTIPCMGKANLAY